MEGGSFRKHVSKCMNRIPGPLGGVSEVHDTPSNVPNEVPKISDQESPREVKNDLKPP